MVNDVLNLTKIQSGTAKLNLERYNFTQSINALVHNTNEMLKGEGYKITFDYSSEIEITADRTLLNQCFYNLLSNAVVHSKDIKEIQVVQSVEDGKVKIEVRDFGDGIDEKLLPHIWERYFKGDKSTSKNIKSSGLGLSIVKTFVEAHNGECGVKSQKGKGSTFWFSINI